MNIGIYSKNRFNNISAEYVEESLKLNAPDSTDVETVTTENTAPESTDVGEVTESKHTLSLGESNNDINLLEECMSLALLRENLLSNYKTVQLLVDESHNEAASEASKVFIRGIGYRMKNASINTSVNILESTRKFSDTANSIYECDCNVFAKYAERIRKGKFCIEEFAGIENFSPMNEYKAMLIDDLGDIEEVFDALDKVNTDIQFAETTDAINVYMQEFNDTLAEIRESNLEKIETICATEAIWKPSTEMDLQIIAAFENAGELAKSTILEFNSNVSNAINDLQINMEATMADIDDPVKANALYECYNTTLEFVAEAYNDIYDLCVRDYANTRKALIICGKACTQESTLLDNMLLGEASDAYVYDKFAI